VDEVSFAASAILELYPSSESGREQPISFPNRPKHSAEGDHDYFMGEITSTERRELWPGESATVHVVVVAGSSQIERIRSGSKWLVFGGPSNLIGEIRDVAWPKGL